MTSCAIKSSRFVARTESGAPSAPGWRRIALPVNTLIDGLNARLRRINTALTGFTRAALLDATEADILGAMNDLRELRLMVRQMRAQARADERRMA